MTLALVLAAEKSPAQEGRDVVLAMLVVGLVFLGVVVFGQLARYLGHKRAARRAERRVY
jgi:hypothetical protein